MVLKEVLGDLLSSESDVICHQVNCQGVMSYGVSKAIRKRCPLAFEQYSRFLSNNTIIENGSKTNTKEFLGLCQISKARGDKYVASLFGQNMYGSEEDKQYTDYSALLCSLFALRRLVLFGGYNIKSIAFPYGMGCGKGFGGDWNKVFDMINAVFNDLDVTIEIRKLQQNENSRV